jgi:hypothetical protein
MESVLSHEQYKIFIMTLLAGCCHSEACALLADTKKVPAHHTSHHYRAVSGETVDGKTSVQETEAGG